MSIAVGSNQRREKPPTMRLPITAYQPCVKRSGFCIANLLFTRVLLCVFCEATYSDTTQSLGDGKGLPVADVMVTLLTPPIEVIVINSDRSPCRTSSIA